MTEEDANEVINAVAEGRSIRSICKERNFSRWGLYAMLERDGVLRDRIAQARAIRDEATEDEILEIADDPEIDPQRQRNRLDARYKVLGARRPERWSNKIDLQVTAKGDARLSDQRADQRLLRLSSYLDQQRLTQLLDITPTLMDAPADKQTASAIDQGLADGIFD
jgi:hypothetical protein